MTLATPSAASFGNIALCLSGGGYRAATYGLGTIDMLELLGFLDHVKLMSTVSGGTFTGVTYALSIADGKPYGVYFDQFRAFLRDNNCVELALKDLYKAPAPSGANDVSLIRAAAMVYDDHLLPEPGRTFSSLQSIVGDDKRFLELIHNATEFRLGNSFRFRASHNPNVLAGNGDFKVSPTIAGEIRLADVIAASSCFPGAFEPIRFPDDFVWAGGLERARDQLKQKVKTGVGPRESGFKLPDGKCLSLPLMDGGIYDNQGISNAVEADHATDDKDATLFDLFLISDTSPRNDDMMQYPRPDKRDGWLSMGMLFWMAVGVFALAAVSAGFLVYYLVTAVDTRSLTWPRFIFQYISPLVMFAVLIGILIWAYRLFQKNREIVVSGAKFKLWPVVRRLSLPDLINMVKARITSLGTMAGDVFMKRVRQLEFNDVMSSPRRNKIAFNLIYDMNPTNQGSSIWVLDPDIKPTDAMMELSACAEAVPTTLWFPKDGEEEIRVEDAGEAKCREKHPDELQLLIACGQCTTCYALLRYLWKRWQQDVKTDPALPKPNDPTSEWNTIYMQLRKIWDELKKDPYGMVDRPRS